MDMIHLKAPGSWINDPNGLIYYKGKYHMFYQHFPFSTRWGTMHWGHAVSDDLLHWEHLGVAIFPSKHYDRDGIFSGGALEVDGKMQLYYSGVKYYASEPDNSHIPLNDTYECAQAMITSEDGFHFDNYEGKKLLIPVIYDNEVANFNHTRDPKVWKENDRYYMLLGSTDQKKIGRLIVLESEDSVNWQIRSVTDDKKFGRILECPDLFEINGQRILMASPMYIVPESEGYTAQSMIGTLDFDPETCQVSDLGEFSFVDHGRDLYAPQSCLDEEGRRLMFGWIRMPQEIKNSWDEKAWNGMMCAARIVNYTPEDGITYSLHPNIREHLSAALSQEQIHSFRPNRKDSWILETTLKNGDELNIGGYRIAMKDGRIHTDRSEVFPEKTELNLPTAFTIPTEAEEHKLTVLVDPNLIEIFVDNGKDVLTNVVYDLNSTLTGPIENIFVTNELACLLL